MPLHTPKEVFQKSDFRLRFKAIAEDPAFLAALNYAMLDYVSEIPAATDMNSACLAHASLVGARTILDKLSTLHLEPERPKHFTEPQLRSQR